LADTLTPTANTQPKLTTHVWILAIDSSTAGGSVALLQEGQVVATRTLDAQQRSAQTLAPAIAELLASQGLAARKLGLVAATVGPGSFTGLRIGVTLAKTLAYATGASLVGISTLEALAHGLPAQLDLPEGTGVEAILAAQRRELFVGQFEVVSRWPAASEPAAALPVLRRCAEDRLLPAAAWRAAVRPLSVVVGPQAAQDALAEGEALPELRRVVADVRADVVGRLAWQAYRAGRRDDPCTLVPVYLRPSYAEEKRSGG
jgi:tRNA threonylcarbamoyladenosine biosynthesis protein TsaB